MPRGAILSLRTMHDASDAPRAAHARTFGNRLWAQTAESSAHLRRASDSELTQSTVASVRGATITGDSGLLQNEKEGVHMDTLSLKTATILATRETTGAAERIVIRRGDDGQPGRRVRAEQLRQEPGLRSRRAG